MRALALVLPVQQDIRLPWKRQHAPQKRLSVMGALTAEKEGILREWLGYTETCSQGGPGTPSSNGSSRFSLVHPIHL